jgi:hypothetical protein
VHGSANEAPRPEPSRDASADGGADAFTRAFAARLLADLATREATLLAERGEALATRAREWEPTAASEAGAAPALLLAREFTAWRTRLAEVGDALVLVSTCLGVPPIGARHVARPLACLLAAQRSQPRALRPGVELAPAGLALVGWRACAIAAWLDAQRRAGAVRVAVEDSRLDLRLRVSGGGVGAGPSSALARGHARGTAWSRWPAEWFAGAPDARH